MSTVIARRPPSDGREWDAQCARCGSSLSFEECEQCGGEGVDGHECGDDSCCCADPEDNLPCDICRGQGAFPRCLSSTDWCKANPAPGREAIEPSTPEWFVVDRP
jgi:hypothetical protein